MRGEGPSCANLRVVRLVLPALVLSFTAYAVDCRATRFETKLVREACASGGQKEAREAMKKFQRRAREIRDDLECRTCHRALAPDFPLEKDALKRFRDLGGE